MPKHTNAISCSFCGKTNDQVRRLIAGPNLVFICDQCVALCQQIIADDEISGGTGSPATPDPPENEHSTVRRPRWRRFLGSFAAG